MEEIMTGIIFGLDFFQIYFLPKISEIHISFYIIKLISGCRKSFSRIYSDIEIDFPIANLRLKSYRVFNTGSIWEKG